MKLKENGITLIALVVTIVVLLILAGVSLNLVLGNNGIVTKARDAKERTEIEEERSFVELATASLEIEKKTTARETAITQAEMQAEMDRAAGIGKTTVSVDADGKLLIEYNDSNRVYKVEPGKDAEINWDDILDTAIKDKNQSTTNNDIGVGTDGKSVNLDLWRYRKVGDNEITLCGVYASGEIDTTSGYKGRITVEGKIEGTVPQYIKIDGESEFRTVTSMAYTFNSYNNYTGMPDFDCYEGTLKIAPKIPTTVKNMICAFRNCNGLETVPEIPSSVEDMQSTFSRCTNLTGELKINANPIRYGGCFYDTSTASTASLVLTGESTMLETLLNTKSTNSTIAIK